jgi:thiamine kinase-like enzyme
MKLGELIGKGRTADIYEWEDNKVIKLYHTNITQKISQFEFEVCTYIQDKLPFVPKIYDKIEYDGKIGIIFEKIHGITFLDNILKNPMKISLIIKQFAKIHVEINKIDFSGNTTQKEYLRYEINRNKILSEELKAKILAYLEKLPSGNMLCHRDYHPDNILFAQKGLCVIDWCTATQGFPAGDVARTYYILKHGQPTNEISFIQKILIKILRNYAAKRYLKIYLKSSNLTKKEIKAWELVTIASRLAENIPHEIPQILKRIDKLLKSIF